jgi:hypothetical protein
MQLPFVIPRNLASGAGDDAESAHHPVAAEAGHGLGVTVEKDVRHTSISLEAGSGASR